ncbi:MAG: aminotransferase class IV [Phycisphaeraceae bacterium]|nr:aminotransferase class IV [Phycisphaeraceae bacterium]
MPVTWLNGHFFDDPSNAAVSAFDAGFQHAVGLFETMTAMVDDAGPRVIHLDEHLRRLAGSIQALDLAQEFHSEPLAEVVLQASVRRGPGLSRIRVTVTGGDLNLRRGTPQRHTPTILVVAQEATPYPPEMFVQGVRVGVADFRSNPLDPHAAHKTLNYWARLRELRSAAARGLSESLVFQVSNHLAGGCVSNVFLASDGRLLTPIVRGEEPQGAIASPILPGVTRSAVIDWAEQHGLEIERRMLSISDVLSADEVFLSNSSLGVLPVVGVEAKDIASGKMGKISESLVEWWRGLIDGP